MVIYPVGVIGDLAVQICRRALQKDGNYSAPEAKMVVNSYKG
jgi:hypothetical protein